LLHHFQTETTVRSGDDDLGPVLAIVVDPATWRATHVVVRNGPVPETGRLVPLLDIEHAGPTGIALTIGRHAFFQLPRYIVPGSGARGPTFAVEEWVPPHRVAIAVAARAVGADGRLVGTITDWAIEPTTGDVMSIEVERRAGLHHRRTRLDRMLLDGAEPTVLRLHVDAQEAWVLADSSA
jgi:hypothetical protein